MKISILDRTKKKKILQELEAFGAKKMSELMIRTGKERIRIFSGHLSNEEIMEVWRALPIEGIGLYFGKEHINKNGTRSFRPSIDGLHHIRPINKEKTIILHKEQEEEWFKGENIDITEEQANNKKGYNAIISSDEKDIIGTGKKGEEQNKIYNYLPKERRRKSNTIQ